ncbi:Ankyrin repeat domain-containing protein, chloroplastic [Vitis vinifera]|uniref:Ankyrin repeat domain-containing protein, chloroplastic n=1 Tax=Vitis vinifera TaxID=29760 RepID=A0A438K5H5_VITVI|nr:Ankyrin repeat domain-containing protein, chloroplastic [Vitis vinifera]
MKPCLICVQEGGVAMLPQTLLNPQNPKIFSLLSSSPLPLHTPRRLYSFQTLTFFRKSSSLALASPSSSFQSPYHQEEGLVEEEEVPIGDCLVFEEGVFEDPYLQDNFDFNAQNPKHKKPNLEIEPENLVPEKWKEVQEQINITKKERRKIAQQLEYGSRVEKRKQGLVPISQEDYSSYRETKLAQLKPLVLDKPTSFPVKEEAAEAAPVEENPNEPTSSRVVPRNPRRAVYGGTLEDISEFFNSGTYQPGGNAATQGPRKLFTKEEKLLLNKRIPDLVAATSVSYTCEIVPCSLPGKWLPLHTLAASGEFYLMDAFLKHNVDINAVDKDGLTALHKAIIGKKQAITNYLLRESANPFVRDKEGATLMHYAVQTASSHAIKILLLYNVDINLQDNNLVANSHWFIYFSLEHCLSQDGLSPLELCLYSGQDTRTYELIKLLKQLPQQRSPSPYIA